MSARAFATVLKAFRDETERAFGFLVTELEMYGPEYNETVTPSLLFVRSDMRYQILLAFDDKTVNTRIEIEIGEIQQEAELEDLVSAAGLGSRNEVANSAHTLYGLRRALETQARFVRELHPLLKGSEARDLMRKANAKQRPS